MRRSSFKICTYITKEEGIIYIREEHKENRKMRDDEYINLICTSNERERKTANDIKYFSGTLVCIYQGTILFFFQNCKMCECGMVVDSLHSGKFKN